MAQTSLERFVEGIRSAWGPLTSETVDKCRRLLAELVSTPTTETWLVDLLREAPDDRLLYRDPAHGFVLMAYVAKDGHYRAPHDHGRGWVLYAVHRGEMEMGTYLRVIDPDGKVRLVKREAYAVRAGDCRAYLPGDIHDTRAVSSPVAVFRLTSCDLKREDAEGRMTRYAQRDGIWTVGKA
jgi:hypothetical protein